MVMLECLTFFFFFFLTIFLSYAPWCPACQNLQPEWESFAEWGEDLEVNVAKVDVTEQPGTVNLWLVLFLCRLGSYVYLVFHITWS